MDVEELIPANHKARAIWELAGKVEISKFTEDVRSLAGSPGRPHADPQLLISLWIYAYSEGISSAREIERCLQWEPGMMWLSGMEGICHTILSDFRVDHKEALDGLFVQLLGLLENAGLISLEQVVHDGTKIRSLTGADSMRRGGTIQRHLDRAQEVLKQMGDPREEEPRKDRRQMARERAARERAERLEAAMAEWKARQAELADEEEKAKVRVSVVEPEARLMKHGDHAIAPSYNAQITTDTTAKIIVGAQLTQCSSDAQSFIPAIEEVERNLNKKPGQAIVDGGYTNRHNIQDAAAQQIDLVGSLADSKERSAAAMKALGIDPRFAPAEFKILNNGEQLQCPAGCLLERWRQNRKRGDLYQQYQARGEDCRSCPYQPQCCPKHAENGRTVSIRLEEQADVAAFRKKMETPEYRAIYRKRGEMAEFPNAWIKDKLGVRKFRVRGILKAGCELMWACLTYNVMQWIRLIWRKPTMA
jgi:transposase